jgi:hypothetical protein
MSFLQPLLLAGLPLIALPILIHLINQRRYQTIRWAAMMFLLAANRMSRGYAKLRQWLILLALMLAIAGLIFAGFRSPSPMDGGVTENERKTQMNLQWILQAEETFKNSDTDNNLMADYWTRDVAGLHMSASGQS